MTEITSAEDINVGDVVEYIGCGYNDINSSSFFTIGKHYVVGGIYHGHKWYNNSGWGGDIGVIADDLGGQNGHRYERFKKVSEAPSSQPLTTFDQWWNKYYPQEYGHNSEFRDIVERHARRAFEAGRNTK